MRKSHILNVVILFFFSFLNAKSVVYVKPGKLTLFKEAYPDLQFTETYDLEKKDWRITIRIPDSYEEKGYREEVLYWSDGAMLPEEELSQKENYWTLLYGYQYGGTSRDPRTFTQEEIEVMRKFGSEDSRQNGPGTPMFFFDTVYESYSRLELEKHIITVRFLGKAIKVHERMKEPLKKVEDRIMKEAETDSEVKNFVEKINTLEGYFWRQIDGTKRKSFHSLGIAIDILPKNLGWKAIFWSWTKGIDPENWMLTPLRQRWLPPQKIIDIFEDEGFIWGGKWAIWDNMHFEYHPELILNAKLNLEED